MAAYVVPSSLLLVFLPCLCLHSHLCGRQDTDLPVATRRWLLDLGLGIYFTVTGIEWLQRPGWGVLLLF